MLNSSGRRKKLPLLIKLTTDFDPGPFLKEMHFIFKRNIGNSTRRRYYEKKTAFPDCQCRLQGRAQYWRLCVCMPGLRVGEGWHISKRIKEICPLGRKFSVKRGYLFKCLSGGYGLPKKKKKN